MERPTLSARLAPDLWDRLRQEAGSNDTERLANALRRLPPPEEPYETAPVETPAAVAAPASTPPDARELLRDRLLTRTLKVPVAHVLRDLGPDISADEDGQLRLDPGDGQNPMLLNDETLDGLLATLRPAAGSGGSGGSAPQPARTPPPKPGLFDAIVRVDDYGNARVDVGRYSAMSRDEQLAFQRGGVR